MNICSFQGCKYPVFSHGYCKAHQRFRTDEKSPNNRQNAKSNQLSPRRRTKLPPVSKKRLNESIVYTNVCKELEAEIRANNNGKVCCFFTGREIKGRIAWHHLQGRDGDFYTDRQWLVPSINYWHLFWHRATVEQLKEQSWYEDFKNRLREKSESLYRTEINKANKETIIFKE